MCVISNTELLRQWHCVAWKETYSRVHEEMYFAIMIFILLHIYLKLLHLYCEVLRRNVFYDMLTPKYTIFFTQPVMCQVARLILLLTVWSWSTKGRISVALSMCQSTDSRTTEVTSLEKAGNNFQAKRTELESTFSVLCTLWENTSMCRAPPWEQLPFNPLFTHPDWA